LGLPVVPLVEGRPGVVVALPAHPVLVARQAGHAAVGGQPVGVAQRDPAPHRGAARVHRLHQRQEGEVEAQDLVLGVVDDPGDLVRMQARVDGVQHALRAADAVVQLQVAIAVPGQCRDPVAGGERIAVEGAGDLARAPGDLRPGAAVDVALDAPRDDLAIAVVAFGELDQRRDRQRLVLHQTQHRGVSCRK
jgi:hypothetical protein